MCVYVCTHMQINLYITYPNKHSYLSAFLTVMYGYILRRGIHYHEYEDTYSNSVIKLRHYSSLSEYIIKSKVCRYISIMPMDANFSVEFVLSLL
jgi:hypothetical protein